MIKVKDIKKEFPNKELVEDLPENCEECGAELMALHSLESIKCPNKKCIGKIKDRLYRLCLDIGLEEMTRDYCDGFITKFKVTNPYAIFLYNPNKDGPINDNATLNQSKTIYKNINYRRGMILSEFIKIGHMGAISKYSNYIFKDFVYFENLSNIIKNNKINFINDWPKQDSVSGISVAAFKLPPSESLIQELINGNAILKLNSISYGVEKTNVLLDISDAPETFKYIIVAWNYEDDIQAQRVIGVYTLTDKSNPDEVILNPGDSLQIEIEVDWNDFPPQPF
jgi:NAD-dependent DNA ligase